jgi:predicted ATPase
LSDLETFPGAREELRLSENTDRFFVLTGGPGSGKTRVIETLRKAGYAGMVEAGRGIIQDQVAIGGRALPWSDPVLFAELMLSWDMRSYRNAEKASGPVFFDRGVVDLAGYFELLGLPVPTYVEKAVKLFRYNRRVFIAPPWEEIFEQDRERKQDFTEAVRTYEAMVSAYTESGYELVELPRVPIEERVTFVLKAIGAGARELAVE